MKKLVVLLFVVLLGSRSLSFAFGFEGHALVGAIAEARLTGTPTAARVSELLGGMSLSRAATLPDELKSLDKHGTKVPGIFVLPENPALERQLKEFWEANPPAKTLRSKDDSDPVPAHHWFHYTDIPLPHTSYRQGKHGRSRWDVVQMIPYCLGVLEGRIPEDNPRRITKPVAVVLLAHYVGDLHQPLHVGAEYFDLEGRPVDPEVVPDALEDQGGNTLFLFLKKPLDPAPNRRLTLHAFWDRYAASAAIARLGAEIRKENPDHAPYFPPAEIAAHLVRREPAGWNSAENEDPYLWSERWADEILPVAREAHARLHYSRIEPWERGGVTYASGFVREKIMPDEKDYADWAGEVISEQIAKAGWRLAALLQKALP
jgi:S1/P1 Nuclease.